MQQKTVGPGDLTAPEHEEVAAQLSSDHAEAQPDCSLDQSSPLTWTPIKKLCHIVPVGMLVFAVTFGSTVISAGADRIEEEFHVSHVASVLPFVSL